MKEDLIRWCGYDWSCKMEGGRIIHSDYPHAWYSDSEDVVKRQKSGELWLYYRENPKEIKHYDGRIFHPTIERAMLRTRQHFDYGYFSLEAICPKGLNLSCAFWLSGFDSWPPEIDILEAWSDNCNYLHRFTNHFPWLCKSWRTTYNVHYFDNKHKHQHLGSKNIAKYKQPLDPTENWIKYECEWLPDKIVFIANDVTTKVVKKKYANMLTKNVDLPTDSYLMDAIIDINVDDPKIKPNSLETPFKVRNFTYESL